MKLTHEELRRYQADGFLLLPGAYSRWEMAGLKESLPSVFGQDGPARVKEAGSATVRSVYGSHRTHDAFRQLSEDARLVEPSRQVVDSEVYVYQFKVNAKAAFAGDVWEWHQDYIFWREEDGMPTPRVANVALFLDEVNEFNGPLFVLAGSHREGVIEPRAEAAPAAAEGEPAWMSNVSAKLNYALDRPTVERLCTRYGMTSLKGPAGTLLLFDSNIVHGSSNNISPFSRVMVIATYNSVHNIPTGGRAQRPEFLVSRDYEPVRPVQPGQLVS